MKKNKIRKNIIAIISLLIGNEIKPSLNPRFTTKIFINKILANTSLFSGLYLSAIFLKKFINRKNLNNVISTKQVNIINKGTRKKSIILKTANAPAYVIE
tara:strand:+ start:564 stop:863 length:300 start_codon:yes stop_codon:yes gene_type:complete